MHGYVPRVVLPPVAYAVKNWPPRRIQRCAHPRIIRLRAECGWRIKHAVTFGGGKVSPTTYLRVQLLVVCERACVELEVIDTPFGKRKSIEFIVIVGAREPLACLLANVRVDPDFQAHIVKLVCKGLDSIRESGAVCDEPTGLVVALLGLPAIINVNERVPAGRPCGEHVAKWQSGGRRAGSTAYPSSARPVSTIASPWLRMSSSDTLHWNSFQLFQPMGGVSASPFSKAMVSWIPRVSRRSVQVNNESGEEPRAVAMEQPELPDIPVAAEYY